MAILLDGKKLAQERRNALQVEVERFVEQYGYAPILSVVLVGDNSASKLYVRNKIKAAKEVGIGSRFEALPADVREEEVFAVVDALNNDPLVHGLLVQLPLPQGLDAEKVIARVLPQKDVDGLTPASLGHLLRGVSGVRPCTPKGILTLLDNYALNITGKRAVVVGRSALVGKPIALMLLEKHATVTLCHSKTHDLPGIIGGADILVCAMGEAEFIQPKWMKEGAVVVDVGMNKTSRGWLGDVCVKGLKEKVHAFTPVPGGVGPMTVVSLLENSLALALAQAK